MICLTLFALVVVTTVNSMQVTKPDPAFYEHWNLFKTNFKRSYKSDEDEKFRRLLWEKRFKEIEDLQQKFKRGEISFEVGVNEFTDWTDEEMKKLTGAIEGPRSPTNEVPQRRKRDVPSSVDWRDSSAVTSVKNQASCGCCYAFAAVAALESRRYIKDGTLLELSEQEIVDCSSSYGNKACNGGSPYYSYKYIIDKTKNGSSLVKQSCYSYTSGSSKNAGTCTSYTSSDCTGSTVSSVGSVSGETNMKDKIANYGPIAGHAYASLSSFKSYKSGVYDDSSCVNKTVDHAMAIIGYGTTSDGKDYWLLKNSWGTTWGESGYVKIARGKNMCSIESQGGYYPTI